MADYPRSPSPEAPRPRAEVISIEGESEERKRLLDHVTVNEHGVATCTNPAGTIMGLVAVRITEDNEAKHIPLVHEPDGRLTLPLPPFKPSKIGFFTGYIGQTEVAAAFRAGDPATPLVTARGIPNRHGTIPIQELVIGLRGIKPNEIDEQQWAIDIGLWRKLGFDPMRSRGLFVRANQKEFPPSTWEERRLVVYPPDLDHPTFRPSYLDRHPNLFHILGYEVGTPNPNRPAFPSTNSQQSGGLVTGGKPEALPDSRAINYHETVVNLGSVSVRSLQAAFEVHIVPS